MIYQLWLKLLMECLCLSFYSVASFFWKASHYCSTDLSLIPEPSGVMSTAALLTLVRRGGNQVRRRVLLTAPLQSRDGLALILMVAADQPPGIILASGITAWRSQFCCHPALSMANQFPKSACRTWAVHRRLANGKRMKTGLALLS